MRAQVHITLKSGVLDPQGEAVRHALGSLGFDEVQSARQGKVIELEIDATNPETARSRVEEMCEQLLANTVIENYEITIVS